MKGVVKRNRILAIIIIGAAIYMIDLIVLFLMGYWTRIPRLAPIPLPLTMREPLFLFCFYFLLLGFFVFVWPIGFFLGFGTLSLGKASQTVRKDPFLSILILDIVCFLEIVALILLFFSTCVFAFIISSRISAYVFLGETLRVYLADFALLVGPFSIFAYSTTMENLLLRYPLKVHRGFLGIVNQTATDRETLSARLEEISNYLLIAGYCDDLYGVLYFLRHAIVLTRETLKDQLSLDLSQTHQVIWMLDCVEKMGCEKDTQVLKVYVSQLDNTVASEDLSSLPTVFSNLLNEENLQYAAKFKFESRYTSIKDYAKLIIISFIVPVATAILALFPENLKEKGVQVYVGFFPVFLVFIVPLPFIYSKIRSTYRRMPSWPIFRYVISARREIEQLVQRKAQI